MRASDIFLKTNTSENAIACASNGAVTLYYDNAAKLATTSTGVSVTGNIDLPSNGAILFDNTSNIEQYYIRNGGGSQSSLQIGKGTPGSDIKFSLDDTGNATFTEDVTTNGFLKLQSQASPQIFMTSNTAGTPNWTMIARNDGYFLLGRSGVSNDFYFDPLGSQTCQHVQSNQTKFAIK